MKRGASGQKNQTQTRYTAQWHAVSAWQLQDPEFNSHFKKKKKDEEEEEEEESKEGSEKGRKKEKKEGRYGGRKTRFTLLPTWQKRKKCGSHTENKTSQRIPKGTALLVLHILLHVCVSTWFKVWRTELVNLQSMINHL